MSQKMSLYPIPFYIAQNPARQACQGYKKQTRFVLSGTTSNLSYNRFLNAGNQFPEGPKRWNLIRAAILQALEDKAYTLQQTSYIAYQIKGKDSFFGILGGIPASKLNHQVLTHEEIYPERVSKFTAYLQNVKFQAEPTVVAFSNNRKWQQIAKRIRHDKAGVRFQKNKEKHQLWLITSETPLAQEIQAFFKEQKQLYLVDGHHRKAAIENMSAKHHGYSLLSFCLPNTTIQSHSYHWYAEEIPEEVEQWIGALLCPLKKAPRRIRKKHPILVRFNSQWYQFSYPNYLAVLSQIKTVYKKNQIPLHYEPYPRLNLPKEPTQKNAVLEIYFYPFQFRKIMDWSDENKILPAKSTYLLPKILTGLVLQRI
jgi:hypothetical protein